MFNNFILFIDFSFGKSPALQTRFRSGKTQLKVFDQCPQLFLTVVNMHKACVYLSHYGAVTFFLQMERVRQEDCTVHLKQTTHAMQREKQQTKQLKRNAMQCNATPTQTNN